MTGEWIDYKGEREKSFYQVRTKSGEEYGPCYPNADTFHVMEGEHSGMVIHESEVAQIKPDTQCGIRSHANCENCSDEECSWRLTKQS